MRVTKSSSQLLRVAASLVHPSVRPDPVRTALHATFIATRLIGGVAAVLALPVYLALWGAPDLLTVICIGWLAAPIAIAFYLSRTGRLGVAHLMSASTLAGLVVFVSAWTGGMASPFLPWLVAIPAEAALSGCSAVVLAATAVAALALAGLGGAEAAGTLPATLTFPLAPWALGLLGVLPALFYAGLLAMRAGTMIQGLTAAERADRDRLSRIVDAASDVILTLRRNGNVTYATAVSDTVLGASPEALCGDGLFARVHVADRPAFLKALDDAAGGATTATELRVVAADPEDHAEDIGQYAGPNPGRGYVWVEMRCRPKEIAGDASPDIVAVIGRIENRKQAEGLIRVAHEEAERANIAKGRFLASMSHELRTPLNAIIGFSEILRAGGPDEAGSGQSVLPSLTAEQQREYAQLIHESGVHLLEVVNDILDMSKIDSGSFEIFPERFDVAELIESCRRMVAEQAGEAGLRLETDFSRSVSQIRADKRACKQIVLNLLSNAVKFSGSGGRIVIGTYREEAGVVVYVADEGVGIARGDVARLGEPFCQLDSGHNRRHQGTGLGLSVVKGLVALHGGSMRIDSEPGVGTRIEIRLPQDVEIEADADAVDEAPTSYRLSA